MHFTSEIFVPAGNLPENTHYDHGEQVFIWNSDGTELFFDKGEQVLFRVESEEWFDQKPTVVRKDDEGNVIDTRGTSWRVIVSLSNTL
jgi:DNA-directed RNA polymerase III subunit RPC8